MRIMNQGCNGVLFLIVLVVAWAPGFDAKTFYLDEVVEDVVDKIFGSSVHGDVNEYLNNCAESRVELQKAGTCVSHRNISFERFNHPAPDNDYVHQLCQDLKESSKCLEPVWKTLEKCSKDSATESHTIEALKVSLNTSLQFFCKRHEANLKQFFQHGLPKCFVTRPGRQLVSCFPGRNGDDDGERNPWGGAKSDPFFNPHSCKLLKEHVDCAVKKHRECVGHDGNTVVFREATKEVLDVLCHDESLVETSKSGAGLAFPALLPFLLSCCTALYLLASHSIRLITP